MSKDRDKMNYGKFFLDKVSESFRGSRTKDKAKGNSFDSCSTNSSSSGWVSSEMKENDFSPINQPPIDFNDLPTPDLLSMFEKLLDDMNLNDAQKEPLRNSSLENKKLLLSQNDRKDIARNKKVPYDSPADYIKLLSNADESLEKLDEGLKSLRVSLCNNRLGWIQAFGQRGLVLLVNKLDWLTEEIESQCDLSLLGQLRHAQHECIKGFRAFMNNKFGLLEVFENEFALISLVQSLSFRNLPAMIDTVKLLAAVSLVNADKNGHSRILEAFTIVGEMKQQFRFSIIVAGVSEFDNVTLQDACMQLINALITQPDELDLRLHLRNEIIRTGLVWELIEQIEETNHEDLKRQVKIFIEHKDNDADEFYQRFENIRTELDTLNGCSELLTQKIRDTSCESYLLSIFQHLLLIRDDYSVRTAYYKLIEEVISQIILYKNGVDPDFRAHKRFQIDVEDTIEKILEKTKEFETSDNHEPSDGIKKKLESAVVAKQESDAKLSQYYAKIQEFSKETGLLREQIKSLGVEINVPETKPLPAPMSSSAIPKAPPAPPLPGLGAIPRAPPPPPFGSAPPAPPPPPFLGSAPPPPPPLPGGLSLGGPRAPPPPPSFGLPLAPKLPFSIDAEPALPRFLTVKKYCTLNNSTVKTKKLKKLNWKSINPQTLTEESFWAKTREQEIVDENLLSDLEEKFSTKNSAAVFIATSKDSSPSDADAESSSCSSSSGTVIGVRRSKKKRDLKVLDSKNGQTLAILQASLKMSHDEFRNALLEIDDSRLYEATLQQLILALPTDDLMKQLISFSNKEDELAEAETFLVKICSIQKLRSRLQSICFKLKFDEMIDDVKPEIVAATEACDEVKNSQGFRKILEIVLLLGNYMNAFSAAKNVPVYAFDINILTKLNDTKSQDNRSTLMHFVAGVAEEKCPKAGNFTGDFIHVAQAARFSSEIVQKQLSSINQSIKKLEIDLKDYRKQCSNDLFVERMSPFLESAKVRYSLVESMYKNLTAKYASLAKYFAFDSKKCNIDEFFNDLKVFKDQFEQARTDNRKLLENEEKLRRAQEMREKTEKEKLERLEQKRKLIEMSSGGNQEGVMDNLMEALRSGQAFPQRSRTPGKRVPTQQKREAYSRRRSRGAD
uniref:Uncharacterized protein n=1 Tax=Romanomermis culicivorax TaxID=13658 RepID=A0A915JFD6_ROMCU